MDARQVIQQVRRKRVLDCALLSNKHSKEVKANVALLHQNHDVNYTEEEEGDKCSFGCEPRTPCRLCAHREEKSPRDPMEDDIFVEISPGLSLRLRGAKETCEYVKQDRYTITICYACTTQICCVDNADYILCPKCRVFGPVTSCWVQGSGKESGSGGVGLGFTLDDLQSLQSEILRRGGSAPL